MRRQYHVPVGRGPPAGGGSFIAKEDDPVGVTEHPGSQPDLPGCSVGLDELVTHGNLPETLSFELPTQEHQKRDPVGGPPLPDDDFDVIWHAPKCLPPGEWLVAVEPIIDLAGYCLLARVGSRVAGEEPTWIEGLESPGGHVRDVPEVVAEHTGEVCNAPTVWAGWADDEDVHDGLCLLCGIIAGALVCPAAVQQMSAER